MFINSVHHIAIIAGNYDRSKFFYTQVLELEIISEVYRAARNSYKLNLSVNGSCQIELFSFPDSPDRLSFPEAKGLRHLAFAVPDIEKAREKLMGKGVDVEPIRVDEFTHKRFAFLADPDGLPLELYEL